MDSISKKSRELGRTRSDSRNRDNIATYIRRIRNRLMEYIISDDAPSLSIDVKYILEKYLRRSVVETIKEAIPSHSLSDLNPEIIETVQEAARLTFIRNEFLLDPQANLLPNSKTTITNYNNEEIQADSYVLKMPRTRSGVIVREDKAMELFQAVGDLVDRGTDQGESHIDVGFARGLAFNVRLKQHQEVKKMLSQPSTTTFSAPSRNSEENRLDKNREKQALVKALMKEMSAVFNPDTHSYLSVEKLSESFVNDIIERARDTVKKYHQREGELYYASGSILRETQTESVEAVAFVEVFGSFTEWPKIGEFNIEMGADRIVDYLATWYYDENWLYDLDMVLAQSDACSDFYVYEVKWSIPSREYPIPQATASTFFTVEVSRVIPEDCYVNVTYKFEGSDYTHEPFKHSFHEKWLFNIIESKLKFFQTITF